LKGGRGEGGKADGSQELIAKQGRIAGRTTMKELFYMLSLNRRNSHKEKQVVRKS